MKKKEDTGTREKIISAATEEFSKAGFHGARVDAIAALSGVNKAMIYYHFGSKEKLYKSIIEMIFIGVRNIVSKVTDSNESPEEKIFLIMRELSNYIGSLNDSMRRVMIWEIASGGKTLVTIGSKTLLTTVIPLVRKTYADGFKKGIIRKDIDPILTNIAMIGAIIFSNIQFMTFKDTLASTFIFTKDFRERFTENLLKIYKKGIAP